MTEVGILVLLTRGIAMRKALILILTIPFLGTGCTSMSLERHTVSQSQSVSDFRYRAALHTLAMVVADPATLPTYALLSNGITSVANTGVVNPVSLWKGAPEVFNSEALGITGTHAPQISWTVSPVADYTQLEAMRCACLWVLLGPEKAGPDCLHILADPEADTSPGSHFGVSDRLTRLPKGWLHVGRLCDVPVGACYKDHCGETWVWVTPDGTEGLANFTLVLQDIATLNVAPSDGSLPANRTPPLLVTFWTAQGTLPKVSDVRVTVTLNKDKAVFKLAGAQKTEIPLAVGETIVWRNDTGDDQTIESVPKGIFKTNTVKSGEETPILFDQAMFAKAGGKPAGKIEIEFDSVEKPSMSALSYKIILKDDPYKPLYSPTLVFRNDRIINPNCRPYIEKKIAEGVSQSSPMLPVQIRWEEWMAMTSPYQGQRASVKPGAGTTTPLLVPASRVSPSISGMQGFGRGSQLYTQPSGDPY